jgi:hypothetical protein
VPLAESLVIIISLGATTGALGFHPEDIANLCRISFMESTDAKRRETILILRTVQSGCSRAGLGSNACRDKNPAKPVRPIQHVKKNYYSS